MPVFRVFLFAISAAFSFLGTAEQKEAQSAQVKKLMELKVDWQSIDMADFLSSFKTKFNSSDGKIARSRVTWVKPDSVVEKAGLKVGDVLEAQDSGNMLTQTGNENR
jgi:hypothetical protein